MFDLITQGTERPLRERSLKSKVAAILTHATALTALVVVPVFRLASVPPQPRTILTFIATSIAPPTLPPPPAPVAPQPPSAPAAPAKAVVVERPAPATEPSSTAEPEHHGTGQVERVAGLAGLEGVEGGVPGGVTGGVGEGVAAPPPAPARPAPAPSAAPVRVGGPIQVPGLLRRVEPIYSPVAAASHLGGVVILEAVVDANGGVESVKVVRSATALLDNAAVDALKQWRYSALMLNGVPTPFVVTVTFRFSIA